MSYKKHCSHQWTQQAPLVPTWVREPPSPTVCPQPIPPLIPNPSFPGTATLTMCTPLQFEKSGPNTVLVTVSIPAESIITLPTKALEIKMIRKNLRITQSRFFNFIPSEPGIPHDTPKLFLRGSVRQDIQYSEAIQQTVTTVTGIMKDFVVDIPISCVIDLGRHLILPPSTSLPSGFSSKDYRSSRPICELLFSEINEMNDLLDSLPLQGGPLAECTFTTLQEKMIILFQLQLTFATQINQPESRCLNPNVIFNIISTLLSKLNQKIKRPHVAP